MKLLNTIRKSILAAADVYIRPHGYGRLARDGFASDQRRLVGDVAKVGNDMRKAVTKYGERTHQPQGD